MSQYYINTQNEDGLTEIGFDTHEKKAKAINDTLTKSIEEARKK